MRLLLSVVSAKEALLVAPYADVIDVKDPSAGPLGQPKISTISQIRKATGPKAVISVALGDFCSDDDAKEMADRAVCIVRLGVDIVKLALTHLCPDQAISAIKRIRLQIGGRAMLVTGAYADGVEFGYLSPDSIIQIAHESGADGVLIDTCRKDGENLFASLPVSQLKSIVNEAKERGLYTALAGSLDIDDITDVRTINPTYIGFRSAITTGGFRADEGVEGGKASALREKIDSFGDVHKAKI